MNYYFAEILLSARNRNSDDGGWMQILIFIVIAVFYGISYIIKAAKIEKPEKQQEKGRPQARRSPVQRLKQKEQRPVSKGVRVQPRRPIQALQREISQPQPVVEKIKSEIPSIYEETTMQEESVGKPLEVLKGLETADLGASKQKEIMLEKPTIKFDDSEMLRKAILHYEILGKPVSLRGPGEHTAG